MVVEVKGEEAGGRREAAYEELRGLRTEILAIFLRSSPQSTTRGREGVEVERWF